VSILKLSSHTIILQDSLRYLVQDSLSGYTQMMLDACCTVLDMPEEITWGDDVIKTQYK